MVKIYTKIIREKKYKFCCCLKQKKNNKAEGGKRQTNKKIPKKVPVKGLPPSLYMKSAV